MSEDLKAIFSQFRRLDAMAQVAGGRINDQAAITKQMTQLLTALRKTKGNYTERLYLKLFYKQENVSENFDCSICICSSSICCGRIQVII